MSYGFTVHVFAFKLSFPFANLIVSSLPRGVLNFHSKIFTRYLGNSQKLPFVSSKLANGNDSLNANTCTVKPYDILNVVNCVY